MITETYYLMLSVFHFCRIGVYVGTTSPDAFTAIEATPQSIPGIGDQP